jgi:hypothetical protein
MPVFKFSWCNWFVTLFSTRSKSITSFRELISSLASCNLASNLLQLPQGTDSVFLVTTWVMGSLLASLFVQTIFNSLFNTLMISVRDLTSELRNLILLFTGSQYNRSLAPETLGLSVFSGESLIRYLLLAAMLVSYDILCYGKYIDGGIVTSWNLDRCNICGERTQFYGVDHLMPISETLVDRFIIESRAVGGCSAGCLPLSHFQTAEFVAFSPLQICRHDSCCKVEICTS